MFKTYENKGLSGLRNLGNSCFMNSAIQCLSNTTELTDYFISKTFVKDFNKDSKYSPMAKEWYRLLDGMYEENCNISPVSFYKTSMIIANQNDVEFGFYNQNDVQEFLVFFIDSLHESLCKKVDINITGSIKNDLDKIAFECMTKWKEYFKNCYSKIIELFYGQMASFIDVEGEIKSRTYNPICFFTLPIANKKDITLYDCFELFTEPELLSGDNKWFNDKDNKYYEANKRTVFWKFPNVLIISFKRFNNFGAKINNVVNFPIDSLDLSKYCMGYDKHKSHFNLFGICNHIGSSNGGHYYSYCKNSNGKWYEYNDSIVREIDEEKLITNNAYCLFYRKINNRLIK